MENKKDISDKTFKISGNWDLQSKQLKTQFRQLTDSDLKLESGKDDELIGRIEKRLNKDRSEIISIISKLQPK